jgi:hypothetical protein
MPFSIAGRTTLTLPYSIKTLPGRNIDEFCNACVLLFVLLMKGKEEKADEAKEGVQYEEANTGQDNTICGGCGRWDFCDYSATARHSGTAKRAMPRA